MLKAHDKFCMGLFRMLSLTGSNYPNIGWVDLNERFEAAHVFDHHTTKANIDVIFKSSFNNKIPEGANRTGLNRGEFYELLTRLAIHKYVSAGIVKTPA